MKRRGGALRIALAGCWRWLGRYGLFLACVVIPTSLAAYYFGFIASDVYVSESRFVIRAPQREGATSLLGNMLQGTSFSHAQEDAYVVRDFMLSRDALAELNRAMSLTKTYGDPAIDPINRFPFFRWDDNFEGLFRYLGGRITADFDSTSEITVLKVRAFSAEDAQRINEQLLSMAERLVNRLSESARAQIVREAGEEADRAQEMAKNSTRALAEFRNHHRVIDPEKESQLHLENVEKLREQLLEAQTNLAQLRESAPQNPQIDATQTKIRILEHAIDAEMTAVSGSRDSLASQAEQYERLEVDKEYADKLLASALGSLDQARNEASRQQLYLYRLVQPVRPDVAIEPRRGRSIAVVLVVGLLAWGILFLLVASVREHMQ